MMKKVLCIVLMIVMCVFLVSCGSSVDLKAIYDDAYKKGKEIVKSYFPEISDESLERTMRDGLIYGSDGSFIKISVQFEKSDARTSAMREAEDSYSGILFDKNVRLFGELTEYLNDKLNLPKSLNERIDSTSGQDGKQSQEFDNVTVTWSYHSNDHYEVMYSKK
ncbi:MAG: hypothetical protein IKN66_12275 [Ruminococcus sp.]|nr:hypothetical protein [Ruminococcus sp.]